MENKKEKYAWVVLRLAVGWIFLWPFIDKVFGLGFSTPAGKGWINGYSPTLGFLNFAVKGPFADFYRSLAGNLVVDWLFMLGILFVGLALMSGIMVRLACFFGSLILFLIYSAGFIWPEHNPFLDEHLINIVIMIGLAVSNSGDYFGFGKWWSNTLLVKKIPILK